MARLVLLKARVAPDGVLIHEPLVLARVTMSYEAHCRGIEAGRLQKVLNPNISLLALAEEGFSTGPPRLFSEHSPFVDYRPNMEFS